MAGKWKEVVRLAFKGDRFRDHALDLSALTELSQFQRMVEETAKALWRTEHPDRERLPRHFENRTRLCLRKIEEGSAVAPLEVYLEEPDPPMLFEQEPTEVNDAIEVAHKVFLALEKDEPLPDRFPRSLIPEYEHLGQWLGQEEEIEVVLPGRTSARVTAATRPRLSALRESTHEDDIDITGEVLEADIRQHRFQVWLDDRTGVTVNFTPAQEQEVTTALRDHDALRLQIVGKGEFSAQGKPLKVTLVEELRTHISGETHYDPNAKPIEDILVEMAGKVPSDEWRKIPSDLTDNLDHYLYGGRKK